MRNLHIYITLACLLLPLLGNAQPDSLLPGFGKKDFRIAATKPRFPGGAQGLFEAVAARINYAELEQAMLKEGMKPKRVMARFWIHGDGKALNHEVLPLAADGSSPVANVVLTTLKSLPAFTDAAEDAYGNPAAFNYVIPVWLHGSKVKVGIDNYRIEELTHKEGLAYFGSFPFTGKATSTHPNGKKKAVQHYTEGLLDGRADHFNPSEEKMYGEIYDMGTLITCFDVLGGHCRELCEGGTPKYLAGLDSLRNRQERLLSYPLERSGRGARVKLEILVNREGELYNARVVEAREPGYGRHAMEFALNLKGKWEPCQINEKPVDTRIVFPIEYLPHVNSPDSLFVDRNGVAYWNRELFTGWVFETGPQLQMLARGKRINGLKEGAWQNWNEQNRPLSSVHYWLNSKFGPTILFDSLGRKVTQEWWEGGKWTQRNQWEYWGADSLLKSEQEISLQGKGSEMGWYSSGEQYYSGELENFQPTGTWQYWYPDGALQASRVYAEKLVGSRITFYDKKAKKMGVLQYKVEKPWQGKEVQFWENGHLRLCQKWKKGEVKGKPKYWNAAGKRISAPNQ